MQIQKMCNPMHKNCMQSRRINHNAQSICCRRVLFLISANNIKKTFFQIPFFYHNLLLHPFHRLFTIPFRIHITFLRIHPSSISLNIVKPSAYTKSIRYLLSYPFIRNTHESYNKRSLFINYPFSHIFRTVYKTQNLGIQKS